MAFGLPNTPEPSFGLCYLSELFTFKNGSALTKRDNEAGSTPLVTASSINNGVDSLVDLPPTFPANSMTIVGVGLVGTTFYQDRPFVATNNVFVMIPKFELTPLRGLFLSTILNCERYRYCYGRVLNNKQLSKVTIRLPLTSSGDVNWDWIDEYMEKLAKSIQPLP